MAETPSESPKLYKAASVRTTDTIASRFGLAVKQLELSRLARHMDGPSTRESVTSALWLWFSRLSREDAESFLVTWLPEVETILLTDWSEYCRPHVGRVVQEVPATEPVKIKSPRKKRGE